MPQDWCKSLALDVKPSMNIEDSSIGDATLLALFRSCTGSEFRQDAAAKFAARYMEKLVSLIQRNIAARFQPRFDAEDVAQSVLQSWFAGVRRRSIHPTSGTEIWPLISVMALNKVRNRIRFHQAERRSVQRSEDGEVSAAEMPDPTTHDATEFEDMLHSIGSSLDEDGRAVLHLILEGYSVAEIAEKLQISTKTVTRRKKEIRRQILSHLPDELRLVAEQLASADET